MSELGGNKGGAAEAGPPPPEVVADIERYTHIIDSRAPVVEKDTFFGFGREVKRSTWAISNEPTAPHDVTWTQTTHRRLLRAERSEARVDAPDPRDDGETEANYFYYPGDKTRTILVDAVDPETPLEDEYGPIGEGPRRMVRSGTAEDITHLRDLLAIGANIRIVDTKPKDQTETTEGPDDPVIEVGSVMLRDVFPEADEQPRDWSSIREDTNVIRSTADKRRTGIAGFGTVTYEAEWDHDPESGDAGSQWSQVRTEVMGRAVENPPVLHRRETFAGDTTVADYVYDIEKDWLETHKVQNVYGEPKPITSARVNHPEDFAELQEHLRRGAEEARRRNDESQ